MAAPVTSPVVADPSLSRTSRPQVTGDNSQDATFRGSIRKHGTSGLTAILYDGGPVNGAWYRPCDAAMAHMLRRYGPGDPVVVRVRGDVVVHVSAPLDQEPTPSKSTAPVPDRADSVKTRPGQAKARSTAPGRTAVSRMSPEIAAANARHLKDREESQRARGQRLRAAAESEQESNDALDAMARLRGTSSTNVLRSANDALDADLTDKHGPTLVKLQVKPDGPAAGVAFNAKLQSFNPAEAVKAATERLGKRPARFHFHNGMLYLSR